MLVPLLIKESALYDLRINRNLRNVIFCTIKQCLRQKKLHFYKLITIAIVTRYS